VRPEDRVLAEVDPVPAEADAPLADVAPVPGGAAAIPHTSQ
jgi:hypothetical protein